MNVMIKNKDNRMIDISDGVVFSPHKGYHGKAKKVLSIILISVLSAVPIACLIFFAIKGESQLFLYSLAACVLVVVVIYSAHREDRKKEHLDSLTFHCQPEGLRCLFEGKPFWTIPWNRVHAVIVERNGPVEMELGNDLYYGLYISLLPFSDPEDALYRHESLLFGNLFVSPEDQKYKTAQFVHLGTYMTKEEASFYGEYLQRAKELLCR